jgi:hypothetical protein
MSTKSDIVWGANDIRVYSDCSLPRIVWGKHIGDDVIVIIEKNIIKQLTVTLEENPTTIKIMFTTGSEAFKAIGCCMQIPCYDVDEFEMDDTDLTIVIKGGSTTAKNFFNKKFI